MSGLGGELSDMRVQLARIDENTQMMRRWIEQHDAAHKEIVKEISDLKNWRWYLAGGFTVGVVVVKWVWR